MSCECMACYECYLAHYNEDKLKELGKYNIKNITVSELIELLVRLDQDSMVCLKNQHNEPETSITLEKFGDFLFIF